MKDLREKFLLNIRIKIRQASEIAGLKDQQALATPETTRF